MKHSALLVVPALALLLIAGCSATGTITPTPAATPPAATPTPATTPGPSAAAPSGTPYHVNIPEAIRGTWAAEISGTAVTTGTWQMEITDNEMIVTNPLPNAEPFALGVTSITTDHVTFSADPDCQGGDVTEATYTYAVQGDHLAFTLIEDACSDRSVLLTSTDWRRQP